MISLAHPIRLRHSPGPGEASDCSSPPPDPATVAEERLDAVGIATELRALPADAIAAQADALAQTLKALSPRIVHYKVCSTFDSAPEIGSIGAAVAVLERHLDPVLIAVVGGQPSLGRYCAFGNLFARGPGGQVHRIDRHPVMRNHPITPMTEADLRLHLARQGLEGLQLEPWPAIAEGPAALKERIASHVHAGERRILFDACDQAHLDTIGSALADYGSGSRPLLVVGASGVAEALGGRVGLRGAAVQIYAGNEGPCLVVAGSRSPITAGQVEAARGFNRMPVRARDLSDEVAIKQLATRCGAAFATGRNVLLHLVPHEDYGISGADLSHKLADLVATILDWQAIRILGVAGGDTSSAVIRRLGFRSLAFEQQLDTGVAICIARSDIPQRDGMRLMLKGGQVGSEAVFDQFVFANDRRALGTPSHI
ncbi:four-carbon acid sugar kinase family protein [Chelativorans alearense]|uniref:four-carbon acid sugar kinase family protein n=1 Tax=Chelativorans alearense TaxID=2681495 RepID=UPI001FE7833B|nr:four-carbon acid sugar kinase family protein [Chelativorans alearense]